ncbi:hypothetical protein NDU88_007606 [Pleurodeles waltl]|uniref:Uncharacterized protein n=1 Tax=Pleurodeles waltl TaxID=8319 RepID=A0AAV7VQ77_PLEWA|nr:hypothetical protein NDU88_007606 [Pleurodeles waltl]
MRCTLQRGGPEAGRRSVVSGDSGQPSSDEEASEDPEPLESKNREGEENHREVSGDLSNEESDTKMPRKKDELKDILCEPRERRVSMFHLHCSEARLQASERLHLSG